MSDITDAGPRLKAMNDRLEELRTAADLADAEYRAEIERLREEKAADWKAACESTRLASAEIARLRLTAEERKAIKVCESDYSDNDMDAACWNIAATLRGLLERMK